jgi:c-di-GMP-binding flagellar brake protein YcgR
VDFDEPLMVRCSGGRAHRGTAENISEFGMMLHTTEEALPGVADEPIWLTFSLPEIPNLVQIQAEVVHRTQDGQLTSLGVRFMPMPDLLEHLLKSYVSSTAN